ncbi:hypothetical protein Tco_0693985 [Tanacetum coccineum]
MTGDRSQLTNFISKFLGIVKFGYDHVAKIMGYGDYQIRNVTISRFYYMEGHRHNLFSIKQFCDSNLKVTFRQHTCFIRNLEGVDQLTGSQGDNLYTLSLGDMMASSPISIHGLLRGLPKLKFEKDHLCSAYAMGKSKKKPHKPKSEDINQEKLYLLHMDLCGPMRVAEAVATTCYTQNRSNIHLRHGKTPYEHLHDKLPDLSFFHVFGALCYPTNDSENLGKLQPKTNIGILFQPMFDELFNPLPSVDPSTPEDIALLTEVVAPEPTNLTSSPSSTTVDQDSPSASNSQTTPETQSPVISNDVEEDDHDLVMCGCRRTSTREVLQLPRQCT